MEAKQIKDLITQNILKLDWIKDKVAQYGISGEVLDEVMDLSQNIEKEGFNWSRWISKNGSNWSLYTKMNR